ncbi:unnamed protein product [Phaedon cochleariae]|uniref:RING-type domain-containing protein n=1 Tax=Phaedon cochleariae TaxID=80249 RepID=A0A9P0DW89_PHACE|nr:unnamed protein product [Phaedon cochleariae]
MPKMEYPIGQIPQFATILMEIFPNTAAHIITDVINMVEEQNPNDCFEGKIENMINLLSGDGAQGPIPVIVNPVDIPSSRTDQLLTNLCNLFPDASESFLRTFCENKPVGYTLDDAVEDIFEKGYDRREVDPVTIWEQLKIALPNADPAYLRREADRLAPLPKQDLDDFVQTAIEKNDYPTMQDYLKTKKERDKIAMYSETFNMEKFLDTIPDPVTFYSDPKRKLSLDENSDENDEKFALDFLFNKYRFIRKLYIERTFKWSKKNLVATCDRLDKLDRSMRKGRLLLEPTKDTKNVSLLQVITYIKYRKQIKRFLKMKDESYRLAKEEAKKYNLLETCQCCFDDELIPEECYFCMKDCVFCKDCVKRGAEHVIGKADIKFPCLANCESEFALHTIQMVLPVKIFARLTQRISSEEIKRANVEGLETCPFCDFAMVLEKDDKIFKCINEDCLIESCRTCRHKSHIPLRCNEIEYDEDVRHRTYIENKMTEALTRTCYKCHKTFIKTNGCNKMTCACGAKMCYLCGAAINDYSHFNPGGCALHTNDVEVNLQRILQSAEQAKQELGNVEIKKDPSVGIREYYLGTPSEG